MTGSTEPAPHHALSEGLSRRALVGGALAAPLLGPAALRAPAAFGARRRSRGALPSAAELQDEVRQMVRLGPRLPGTRAHERFVDHLEDGFEAAGIDVERDRHRFTRWTERRRALELLGGTPAERVPVASSYPYSGQTGPGGVSGQLVQVADGASLAPGSLTGRIALLDVAPPPLTSAVFLAAVTYMHDPGRTISAADPYERAWTTILTFPMLAELRAAGALGAVFVLDASAANARGQYTPFGRPLQGLPALIVDRDTGTRLRAAAAQGRRARLTLEAEVARRVRSDSLVAVLPGRSRRRRPLIVHTHSDGQNAFEENGGIALVALARWFARRARRLDRTLVLSCVTGHFGPGLPETEGFIEDRAGLVERAVAAVVLEHLGASEWLDDERGYRPTGLPEQAAIFHTPGAVARAGRRSMRAADLRRSLLLKPLGGSTFFGVGRPLHEAGVPTLAYLAGPNYLLALDGKRGHLGKFRASRMRRELLWAADALRRLDATPASELRPGRG